MKTYILQTITSVHVGEGSAAGSVKLPITRERHTGWPILPGSSIKGALRSRGAWVDLSKAEILAAFGSDPGETPLLPGGIQLGGASILALPVRTLKGTFALLTCPLALGRLARMQPDAPYIPSPSEERALLHPAMKDRFIVAQNTVGGEGLIVLEELSWLPEVSADVEAWASWLGGWLKNEAPLRHLVIVHDNVFSHAATFWTPARTRAAIGDDGVVEDGKLFSVEALPPEALLWGQVRVGQPELEQALPEDGESWGLGGHRTVGSGRVAWYRRKEA